MANFVDPSVLEKYEELNREAKHLASIGHLQEALTKLELAKKICPSSKVLRRIEMIKFVADGEFKTELNEFLRRELSEDGCSGVEVRVTKSRTNIVIPVTRTQTILGEKDRRIRELTSVVQKRFNFEEGSVQAPIPPPSYLPPRTYTRQFLLECARFPLCQNKPHDYQHIADTFPEIIPQTCDHCKKVKKLKGKSKMQCGFLCSACYEYERRHGNSLFLIRTESIY